MNNLEIIESLSPIERKLIPLLNNEFQELDKLIKDNLDKTTILRASTFLESKGLVELKSENKNIIDLGVLGIQYNKTNLPERILLNFLFKKRNVTLDEVKQNCKLNENEIKVAIGTLKKKVFININNDSLELIASGDDVAKNFLEEDFIKTLPREIDSLEPQEKLAYENLKKRKQIIELKEKKEIKIKLTKLGLEISNENLSEELIEQLTPKLIKSNYWKGRKFRRYNLESPVPKIYGGKRHFVNQATDYAKQIWLDMGFKEMVGDTVITGFYNFDALFTAQDHPVREMQDTFFLKDFIGELPDKKIVEQVLKAHEGKCDNSLGWCNKWNEDDAKKVLLRTHTTPWSIQTLHKIAQSKEFPAKYFALGKCFRNETVDWSHGFEFNQTEGIVIDENANFRQLLGYLIQFFNKMGYEKVRIRPAYFPYTEPSLELDIFHPVHKKWVELGGAGMFRPEVTIPIFGRHIPVLAWGPGFDRIIMEYYNILDLRDMYKNNIKQLREMKFWNK
ncbi:MAG: phenylalanine--tRNA ligase subunit alpha [Candidatus Nanoarchaeia archaeon]|nr:phenylalanine--tRNA ligase subunit alpha [Candidatus Nanoarchaeia archaeon]